MVIEDRHERVTQGYINCISREPFVAFCVTSADLLPCTRPSRSYSGATLSVHSIRASTNMIRISCIRLRTTLLENTPIYRLYYWSLEPVAMCYFLRYGLRNTCLQRDSRIRWSEAISPPHGRPPPRSSRTVI